MIASLRRMLAHIYRWLWGPVTKEADNDAKLTEVSRILTAQVATLHNLVEAMHQDERRRR